MDPLAAKIKPELLDELLKMTKDPRALFSAGGVLQQLLIRLPVVRGAVVPQGDADDAGLRRRGQRHRDAARPGGP